MSFGHALYYPHINLTNKNWVKHSLLFWDKISRIVPSSVEPADNEDITSIKYHTGFIEDYHPENYDTSNAFNQFSDQLRYILESDHFFHDRYFEREKHRRYYRRDYYERRNFYSDMAKSSGTYIHVMKIDPRMKEYLFEIGIAVPGENEWEDWVKIDNEIGLLYMAYLAKSISMKKTLPIVTDVEHSFSAAIQFEEKINSDYKNQFEYRLGNLLIEAIVPKRINDVPLDKIIDIRENYSAERIAFFNEISNLTNSIPDIDNTSSLKDALNHYSRLILKEAKHLEKLYETHKIETVNKFLSISVPTTIASLSELIPDIAKPIVTTGGVIFGIISSANSVKKEKLELQANPKSYLLNLKSELSGSNMFSKINDNIKGIRKW
ncbi:DUF6236 family protein [Chryseobacterium gambrini]|uniref:DUF6236 family protein n=1 Tax=Chryseobacterium gambrini TaxID=373672 RepID=UPI0022F3B899|nr:DUF6236 family protein [Chryseobacterium gambrini]WBX98932.1 DUF6236 family protein [Chryseobacterium gambrini]